MAYLDQASLIKAQEFIEQEIEQGKACKLCRYVTDKPKMVLDENQVCYLCRMKARKESNKKYAINYQLQPPKSELFFQ